MNTPISSKASEPWAASCCANTDGHRGRKTGQQCKVAIIGTAGLLVRAKLAGAVDKVRPLLLALRDDGNFLNDRLFEAVLAQSGE